MHYQDTQMYEAPTSFIARYSNTHTIRTSGMLIKRFILITIFSMRKAFLPYYGANGISLMVDFSILLDQQNNMLKMMALCPFSTLSTIFLCKQSNAPSGTYYSCMNIVEVESQPLGGLLHKPERRLHCGELCMAIYNMETCSC